jgi:hypothetical protein
VLFPSLSVRIGYANVRVRDYVNERGRDRGRGRVRGCECVRWHGLRQCLFGRRASDRARAQATDMGCSRDSFRCVYIEGCHSRQPS